MFAKITARKPQESSFEAVMERLREIELFALGVVAVALVVAAVFGWNSGDFVKIVGVSVLLILAMGSVGAFLGFLFAIPRVGSGLKSTPELSSELG